MKRRIPVKVSIALGALVVCVVSVGDAETVKHREKSRTLWPVGTPAGSANSGSKTNHVEGEWCFDDSGTRWIFEPEGKLLVIAKGGILKSQDEVGESESKYEFNAKTGIVVVHARDNFLKDTFGFEVWHVSENGDILKKLGSLPKNADWKSRDLKSLQQLVRRHHNLVLKRCLTS